MKHIHKITFEEKEFDKTGKEIRVISTEIYEIPADEYEKIIRKYAQKYKVK